MSRARPRRSSLPRSFKHRVLGSRAPLGDLGEALVAEQLQGLGLNVRAGDRVADHGVVGQTPAVGERRRRRSRPPARAKRSMPVASLIQSIPRS